MIFAPKGIKDSSVVDPNEISKDFIEASRIATNQTQYQWMQDGINDLDKLEFGAGVSTQSVNQVAYIRGDAASQPVAHQVVGGAGFNPELTAASGDPNLFQIPYNRGFQLITGGNDMTLTWDSDYPELILAFFSFQYCRDEQNSFFPNLNTTVETLIIRSKISLFLDGSSMFGSGIHNLAEDSSGRGTGYGPRNLRTTIRGLTIVGAGSHTLEARASQSVASVFDEDDGSTTEMGFFQNPPDDKVVIAHRTLNVIRFPKGTVLGG